MPSTDGKRTVQDILMTLQAAESDDEGTEDFKYIVDIPVEWNIEVSFPAVEIARGKHAIALEAFIGGDTPVVVLVRPLDVLIPSKECMESLRTNSKEGCQWLASDEYAGDEEQIREVVGHLDDQQRSDLLPRLFYSAQLEGYTTNPPSLEFNATKFGVEVWGRVSKTLKEYMKGNENQDEQQFDSVFDKHVLPALERLAALQLHHDDLHPGNVALALEKGEIVSTKLLDPSAIRFEDQTYRLDAKRARMELFAGLKG